MSHLSNFFRWCTGFLSIMVMAIQIPVQAQSGMNLFGSFEQNDPSYWTKGAEPSGSTLEWAQDEALLLSRSLKITKGATAEAAKWTSENMCDNWSPTLAANSMIQLQAWVKTEGINTNPATDDAKWMIKYSYYDQSGGFIGAVPIELNQTVGTSDWTAVKDSVSLPTVAYKVIIEVIGGKDATGTVWADAFLWPSDWNQTLELPTGWFNWFPLSSDYSAVLNGYENTRITTEEAHTGLHSLKFDLPFNRAEGDAFVGTRRVELGNGINPGDWIRISVWVKASNLVPDSAAKYPESWAVGFTALMFSSAGNNDGYDNIITGRSNDRHFKFPNVTSFDWTEYYEDVQIPTDGLSKAIEVRIHPYAKFTGKIYFDDLKIEKLDIPEVAEVGSFEQTDPSYWTKGAEPSGSTLEWAQDEALLLSRSLKITKGATAEAAKWTSENMCDNWSPTLAANSMIHLQAWVKTEGINTNPATDDAKWMIKYSYYDQSGGFIGAVPIELNQTVGTSDWTAVKDSVSLPTVAYKVIIEVIGGKDATGTVWADAFLWPSDWNQTLELPTGWFNWFPLSSDYSAVLNGYENTRITTEEAHTGLHSLKFDLPFNRAEGDAFVGTRRVELGNGINPGDWIRISVWVKASNLVPDSAAKYPESWAVGFTALMFSSAGNNDGYDNIITGRSNDRHFKFPNVTSFDWTEYYEDVQIPTDGLSKAIEVRIHPYAKFTGKIYFDDLKIEKLDIPEVAEVGSFEQTDPSYWTKGAEPSGSTLEWAQDEALLLSRSLKITKGATAEAAKWTSENMCDNWSPTLAANSMIHLQAWVKTEGINTNPATDDAKWMIKYSYYDQSDVFIGAVPIELNQTVGTSDWTAVKDSVSLPTVAYKVIIEVIGGKDATGTVWADAFLWPSDWNQTLELPTGWFNWFPLSSDYSAVLNGYENTRITTEEAHTGLHSLKFDLPFNRAEGDAFVGTRRVELGNGINPGDWIRISVWVKASNLVPDSAAKYPESWAVGFTALMFSSAGNNDGYDNIITGRSNDRHFKFPNVTSFDWTEYYEDVQIPTDGLSKAIEVRIHPYAKFTGKIYFDDLKIEVIQKVTGVEGENGLPVSYDLSQNYPNPFNPTTTIRYSLPTNSFVTLRIYDILGREVKTLISTEQNSGTHSVQWNGDNNYGTKVSSGIYLYRIEAANFVMSKKMIMLK